MTEPKDLRLFSIKRREVFEIAFLLLLVVSSAASLLVKASPGSLQALLPGWYTTDWSILMLVGSTIATLGIFGPDVLTGLFLERVGINIVSSGLVIYAGAAGVFGGLKALTSISIIIAMVVAFFLRSRDITRVLKKLPSDPL